MQVTYTPSGAKAGVNVAEVLLARGLATVVRHRSCATDQHCFFSRCCTVVVRHHAAILTDANIRLYADVETVDLEMYDCICQFTYPPAPTSVLLRPHLLSYTLTCHMVFGVSQEALMLVR